MKIRVLLAEDHRMLREALRDTLKSLPDIEVVGEAGDAQGTLETPPGCCARSSEPSRHPCRSKVASCRSRSAWEPA